MGAKYQEFHRRSIEDRDAFWTEQSRMIDWHRPFGKVLDYARPPFAKWFVGGETNLCHNAVDRHLAARGEQTALVWISTEGGGGKHFTYPAPPAISPRAASRRRWSGSRPRWTARSTSPTASCTPR